MRLHRLCTICDDKKRATRILNDMRQIQIRVNNIVSHIGEESLDTNTLPRSPVYPGNMRIPNLFSNTFRCMCGNCTDISSKKREVNRIDSDLSNKIILIHRFLLSIKDSDDLKYDALYRKVKYELSQLLRGICPKGSYLISQRS